MEPQFDYLLDVTPDVYEVIMGMGDSLPEDHIHEEDRTEEVEAIIDEVLLENFLKEESTDEPLR